MEVKKELSKIEGHAVLRIKLEQNKPVSCRLEVEESPRYFEAIMKGRNFEEIPYFAGRICGVCNIAHLLCAIKAVENALKVEVEPWVEELRAVLELAQVAYSHALHLYFLALPDYLNKTSVLEFEKEQLELVKKGIELKDCGAEILRILGGRVIHPVTWAIGGFRRVPEREEISKIIEICEKGLKLAMETFELFSGFEASFPFDAPLFATESYDFTGGALLSDSGLKFEPKFGEVFEEVFVGESAKKCYYQGKPYLLGPLARIMINKTKLSSSARELASSFNFKKDLYHANVARAVEIVHSFERIAEIIENFEAGSNAEPELSSGIGYAAIEAPRGTLFYEVKVKDGKAEEVDIVTPTQQNLALMEACLQKLASQGADVSDFEKLIRAFDPCFSCSAHFLKVIYER